MSNTLEELISKILPYILLVMIILVLSGIILSPGLRDKLRESLFRNSEVRYRNTIGLLLGFVAAMLLLSSGALSTWGAAWWFVGALAATMLLFILVRANEEFAVDRFAWGLPPVIVLGFGSGALLYQTRSWWIWLWNKYRLINEPHELVLEFLFLLGVILGVFVVRNWSKEQEAFTKSLSGLLGGTFIAGIFGESMKGQGLTTIGALTYYGLGFVISASINLLFAARLTANYTNQRSISSRALLDFLYGSERTKLIDGYFLQNFKDDPDYAKLWLTETLIEWRKLIQREFANRLERRRSSRKKMRVSSPPAHDAKPSFFYELIAIEGEVKVAEDTLSSPPLSAEDPQYSIIYKHVGSSSPRAALVEEKMFRVGVSLRWQDKLETITAPGQYRVPFPYQNSVAGMALEFRQTIVMDRDIRKRFRNKEYPNGICPKAIEQDRGLDEIEYLSYVAIPIVGRAGSHGENPLGVVTIDTRLFVTPSKLAGEPINTSQGIFRISLRRSELSGFATNLYEHEDEAVKYIESLTALITPVLELYSKCRVGAT